MMALRLAGCVCSAAGKAVVAANRTLPSKVVSHSVTGGGCESRRGYAMRLELTEHGIVWRRPKYVPSWQPEKSGDLKPYQPPSLDRLRLDVVPAASYLDQVGSVTRQLLTLRFSNKQEQKRVGMYDMVRRVQRHQYDSKSIEVHIAKLTVTIRNLQVNTFRSKKNKRERIRLQETIDRRKKLLKILRGIDYKRFEWLIEELGILYRPLPRKYIRITRKESLQRLVELHGKEIREKRMAEYQATQEKQKIPFLKEKEETLRWIAGTESSLGLPVTVSLLEKTKDLDQKGLVKS